MPVTASELTIDHRATANEMAETIFGDGVQINTATYTGDPDSSGTYSDGFAIWMVMHQLDSDASVGTVMHHFGCFCIRLDGCA